MANLSIEERQAIQQKIEKLEVKLEKLRKKHKFKEVAKVDEEINQLKWKLEQ